MTNDATDAEVALSTKVMEYVNAHPGCEHVNISEAVRWYDREHGEWTAEKVLREFADRCASGAKWVVEAVPGSVLYRMANEVARLRNRPAPDVESAAKEIDRAVVVNGGVLPWGEIADILRRHLGCPMESVASGEGIDACPKCAGGDE